jgi:hypothetical protein
MSDEAAKLAKLAALSPPTDSLDPVIAVDLDDVLSQTNRMVAQCQSSRLFPTRMQRLDECLGHNDNFGTEMDLSQFYCQSLCQ